MNIDEIKQQFPIFTALADTGEKLHYLDNAATAHKPKCVVAAIADAYTTHYGPVARGLYSLAEKATSAYETSRSTVAKLIHCAPENVIFTRSATESLNVVAQTAISPLLKEGDEVWITQAEHHANYLPWQRVCDDRGASLRVLEIDENGKLVLPPLQDLKSGRVKCLSMSLVSNVLGYYADVPNILQQAKAHGIITVVDAAQAIAHHPIDVSKLECDFLAFSGHKMFGPTGIGVLYVSTKQLLTMKPHLLGGGMVDWVGEHHQDSVWSPGLAAHEAGSPNYSGAIGLAAAAEFLQQLDRQAIEKHLSEMAITFGNALKELPGYIIFGDESNWQAGIVTFTHKSVHPHDIAQICAEQGVAIRAGHHCAQPLMEALGHPSTVRASFSIYNDQRDIEALIMALVSAEAMFS